MTSLIFCHSFYLIVKDGILIVKAFGHSGAEKSLIKTSRKFGFQFGCFDDISKEEKRLKEECAMRYPAEINKIEAEIRRRMDGLYKNLENIEKIKNSEEYKGAVGELKVIRNLENLPDSYFLFSDVFLELDRYMTFRNSKLKSAQIDHIVVGPTGIYVIEVKNWSYGYIQKVFGEKSYTPYDQIERSSYLTYRYLNSLKYGNILQKVYFKLVKDETKVKSIIAVSGANIPYTKKRHTIVLRSNDLSAYIQKDSQIFSSEEADKIAKKLSYRVLA